jgi:hypothetical protein
MKKMLWIVLGTISFINNIVAKNSVGIHFANNTSSTIYLTSEYLRNSHSCRGKFTNIVTVEPGKKYKFSVAHKQPGNEPCYLSLVGHIDKDFSESTIVIQENFHVNVRNFEGGDYISAHDTPPSKCGLGMTCTTHLANRIASFYIKINDKKNQYVHVVFNNNKPEARYIKFSHFSGKCNNYIKNNSWFKVLPEETKIGYIFNPRRGKTCNYRVDIAQNRLGKNIICSVILEIYKDFSDNTVINSVDSTCNTVLSNNNWLANITLD